MALTHGHASCWIIIESVRKRITMNHRSNLDIDNLIIVLVT